ncbi:hypothetical protein NBRC116493_24160 [Aurantivibrio infirmus]
MTIGELEDALSEEELLNLSAEFVLNKMFSERNVAADYELFIAAPLSKLMYFYDKNETVDSRTAIKKFQRDLEHKQTGDLTFGEFGELTERAENFSMQKITLGTFGDNIKVHFTDDFAFSEGTWIIENDKIANPINHAKITCYKGSKECVIYDASIYNINSHVLSLNDDYYEVLSWNENEIIAQSTGNDSCRKVTMTLNAINNEVYQITRNNNTNSETCSSLEPLASPRVSKLVPGWQISYDYWNNLEEKNKRNYYNSDYMKEMEIVKQLMEKAGL